MALNVVVPYTTDLLLPDDQATVQVGSVRLSQTSLTLTIDTSANVPDDGVVVNTTIPIRVTGTRRYGITARHLVIARISGTGTNLFRIYRKIAILSPTLFQSAVSTIGATISYENATDWTLVGAEQERYKLFSDISVLPA